AQDVIIREDDCGTDRGLPVSELSVGAEVIEPLLDRLVGRIAFEDVANPETGDMIISKGDLISEDQAKLDDQAGIKEVTIRSAFTCNTKNGVCKQCYGRIIVYIRHVLYYK